jgi:hypothetical protein
LMRDGQITLKFDLLFANFNKIISWQIEIIGYTYWTFGG